MRYELNLSKRKKVFLISFWLVWPFFTILFSACELRINPYIPVSWSVAILGATAGVTIHTLDFIVIGGIFSCAGSLLFTKCENMGWLKSDANHRYLLEILCFVTSIIFWTLIWYPTICSQPLFWGAYPIPLWALILIIFGLIVRLVILLVSSKRKVGHLFAVVILVGFFISILPLVRGILPNKLSDTASTVVLGLDSVSAIDNVKILHSWATEKGATYYEKAVTPGLLTNSVWTSIITMRSVSQHKIFTPFQPFSKENCNPTLLDKARLAGFSTVSVFPDQLTTNVGSQAGFDENLSGPMGWRQIVTAVAENASIFLPLIRPWLPNKLLNSVPSNHSGSFTYDLGRELRGIFNGRDRILIMSHLTYLHSNCYPNLSELSSREWFSILKAPLSSIRDRSFDFQDVDRPDDPILLHKWKLNNLQNKIIDTIQNTHFIERGGRLILFSDHGDRVGLTQYTADSPRYWQVILLTIGFPSFNNKYPVSLTGIADIIGLYEGPANISTKLAYVHIQPDQWEELYSSCKLHLDGTVEFNENLLDKYYKQLRCLNVMN